jgi:hypothetical protein
MRYQVAIWIIGLLTSAGVGAWLAWSTSLPVLPSAGALVGVVLGTAVVAAFLHSFGTDPGGSPAQSPTRR